MRKLKTKVTNVQLDQLDISGRVLEEVKGVLCLQVYIFSYIRRRMVARFLKSTVGWIIYCRKLRISLNKAFNFCAESQLLGSFSKQICLKCCVVTLVETKSQTWYSPHRPDLHFLVCNDPYFHVGYAPKIESGASHNIKFQKTKFSQ